MKKERSRIRLQRVLGGALNPNPRNVPSFAVNTPIISDTPSDEYPTGRCGLQVRDDVFLQFGILELSVRFFPFRERTP
jgi:hypothetical protein